MTTPARITRPETGQDLVVTVSGPKALDGLDGLDPYACEPRLWTVVANHPLAEAPDVAIGSQQAWHRTEQIDATTFRLLVAGPEATGGVAVALGSHRTWLRITDGDVQLVRAAGRLKVQTSRKR